MVSQNYWVRKPLLPQYDSVPWGQDAQLLDRALGDWQVLMVPIVLTELQSDRHPCSAAETLSQVPMIEVGRDYWQRAGLLRAKVLATGRKARLRDALIAQTCIDRGVSLVTRDRDLRAFAALPGSTFLLF